MPTFVDLFCGAGFGARGAVRGGGVPLLGLDAWSLATQTYKSNFPQADILTEKIEEVSPKKLGSKYRPDVLLTSPECTSHSIARGSKPGTEKSRETAIGIVPWVQPQGRQNRFPSSITDPFSIWPPEYLPLYSSVL